MILFDNHLVNPSFSASLLSNRIGIPSFSIMVLFDNILSANIRFHLLARRKPPLEMVVWG